MRIVLRAPRTVRAVVARIVVILALGLEGMAAGPSIGRGTAAGGRLSTRWFFTLRERGCTVCCAEILTPGTPKTSRRSGTRKLALRSVRTY